MRIDSQNVRKAIVDLELMTSADKLQDDVPLQEQGMDSLDMANLLLHFEESCGVRIPDAEAEKVHCIREIVDVVNAKLGSAA